MVPKPNGPSFEALVDAAAHQLGGQGWRIARGKAVESAAWHLVARKGVKLRFVQLVPPATPPERLQARRVALGGAVALAAQLGTMEQWLAHRRPDGRYAFGPYVLSMQRWAETAPHAAPAALARLGL